MILKGRKWFAWKTSHRSCYRRCYRTILGGLSLCIVLSLVFQSRKWLCSKSGCSINSWHNAITQRLDNSILYSALRPREPLGLPPHTMEMIELVARNTTTLSPDAQFIVDSVVKAHYEELPTSSFIPPCQGDRLKHEVEDILCIPRPQYLPEVRNPCWWDTPGRNDTLRCLPYFHILGCEKCASSDLWFRISSHPHVFKVDGIMKKEANWWNWGRYGYLNIHKREVRDFKAYTNSFMALTKAVKQSLLKGDDGHKMFIAGDATPSDLWDFRFWNNITQNRGLHLPRVLVPHLMKHFYPDPKFIVIFRNPVDRLYSDYYYVNKGKNGSTFHIAVLGAIEMLAKCIRARGVRECFFDPSLYLKLPVRFHYLFYSLYLPEWFKVFPRDIFLFLKTEEYNKDIEGTVKKCMDFLKLETLNNSQLKEIATKQRQLVNQRRQRAGSMLPNTRKMLEEITRPFRLLLAKILKDDKFTWE